MTEPQSAHPIYYRYAIHVQECLDSDWSTWFDGLTLTAAVEGGTLIEGVIVDQAALHGLLAKLRNLNLTLISVQRLAPVSPDEAL